jgi:lipopolysaccharide export system protein LptA
MNKLANLPALLVLAIMLWPCPSAGQSLSVGGGKSAPPIDVEADNGIEWQRSNKIIKAIGNAHAVRGDLDVKADVLSAHYRERADGNTEIWRLEANGNVRITTPTESAYAEKGVYDVDNGVVVLSGGKQVRLTTADNEITADRQIEFWPEKQTLVAQGNASAIQGDNRLNADTLTGYFERDGTGRSRLTRVEAVGNVRVTTPDEVVTANRGVYNIESGIATLVGSVKITRGANQLNGCSGEIDMKAGVSKIHGCKQGSSGASRVQGLIVPEAADRK